MTEWRRLDLVKTERDAARARVAELELERDRLRNRLAVLASEVEYLRNEYELIETLALDLTSELAAVRLESRP